MHEDWYKQFKILTKSKSKSPNPFTEISEHYIDWIIPSTLYTADQTVLILVLTEER